jgi:hypothetical protein
LFDEITHRHTSTTVMAFIKQIITFAVNVPAHLAFVFAGISTNWATHIEKVIRLSLKLFKTWR